MFRSYSSNRGSGNMSLIFFWKYQYWLTKYIFNSTLLYLLSVFRCRVLMAYHCFVYFFRYPNTLFSNSIFPSLGSVETILRYVTAYVKSNLPATISHWQNPIMCWKYLWPFSSRNGVFLIMGVPWVLVVILPYWDPHILLTPL